MLRPNAWSTSGMAAARSTLATADQMLEGPRVTMLAAQSVQITIR